MSKFILLLVSFSLMACTNAPSPPTHTKGFVANQTASHSLDMSKEEKNRSGAIPFSHDNMLSVRFFNTHPVPMDIYRIEFPLAKDATCAIKSTTNFHVEPFSAIDIDLINISILAQCHPDLLLNKGMKLFEHPKHSYVSLTNTSYQPLQVDAKVYKSMATYHVQLPLTFGVFRNTDVVH